MITTLEILSKSQEAQVQALVDSCCQQDHCALSYPFEDAHLHYFYTNKQGTLLSVLALVSLDEDLVECSAFTLPSSRQRGYFSQLLEQALLSCQEADLLFLAPDSCAPAAKVLTALDATLLSKEYQMELSLSVFYPPSPIIPQLSLYEAEKDPVTHSLVWQLKQENDLLGSCHIQPLSPTCACLHHVEIPENKRGQGYGTCLLSLLFSQLKENGISRILLHVSANNTPAISLYKKTGFRITETLSSFLY